LCTGSHNWANQDVVHTLKRQLQLLLPGVRVFLDVDDLVSIDELEAYMEASAASLILLGSDLYFRSANCLREVVAAQRLGRAPICVHDSDVAKNGQPLSILRAACPEEHRRFVFGGEVIRWHRMKEFQQVALAQVAERMLLATLITPGESMGGSSLVVDGGLAWAPLRFAHETALYLSTHNPGAVPVARHLLERFADVRQADALGSEARWLLFLSADCFTEEQLVAELVDELHRGVRPVMAFAPEDGEFGAIIDATPAALRDLGLYNKLAIEWRGGALQLVSVQLLARALGAEATGDVCGCESWRGWSAHNRRRVGADKLIGDTYGEVVGLELRDTPRQLGGASSEKV
jgi:hypothetical protein